MAVVTDRELIGRLSKLRAEQQGPACDRDWET